MQQNKSRISISEMVFKFANYALIRDLRNSVQISSSIWTPKVLNTLLLQSNHSFKILWSGKFKQLTKEYLLYLPINIFSVAISGPMH